MKDYYTELQWDSELFGFKVAQIFKVGIDDFSLSMILKELKENSYRLIYWQIPYDDYDDMCLANKHGGFLADERITYAKKLKPASENKIKMFYDATLYQYVEPEPTLIELALASGEYSRYKQDPLFPKHLFEKLYKCWIVRSIHKEIANDTLVVKDKGDILGMITLQTDNYTGNIGLLAVAKEYRRKGIGKLLVEKANQYFLQKGYSAVKVNTQNSNIAACILYESCGFVIEKRNVFFHFWL